jgi:hypothetical protein
VRRAILIVAVVIGLFVLYIPAHLALIETGREVIVLRTRTPEGEPSETRLWIVDHGETPWLHGNLDSGWMRRIAVNPIVEVERGGETRKYRAVPVAGPHPRIDELLREKYGLADRWVRLIAPDGDLTVPVRLEPL